MARQVIVEPNQCIEDIALQCYGDIDGVRHLVEDNIALFPEGFSTVLEPGTVLVVRDEPINKPMHDTARKLRVVPVTFYTPDLPTPSTAGDYNDDFNNDHNISNA